MKTHGRDYMEFDLVPEPYNNSRSRYIICSSDPQLRISTLYYITVNGLNVVRHSRRRFAPDACSCSANLNVSSGVTKRCFRKMRS